MPYWGDPDFSKELVGIDKVWRYINFEKYVDLLERKKQYFVSGSKLQDIDPYEGHFEKLNFLYPERVDELDKQILEQKDKRERYEDPKSVFINCWHINEDESMAMWKLYAGIDNGIAIQTTLEKLKKSFHEHIQRVEIRKVQYIDYKKQNISIPWISWRFSKKGKSFSHENELRVIIEGIEYRCRAVVSEDGRWLGSDIIPQDQQVPIEQNENGIWAKVDLAYFIEKIYVSPLSQDWFLDLVKSITKRYGLDPNIVEKSPLYNKP